MALIGVLVWIAISAALTIVSKRRFEEVLPLSIFFVFGVLFICFLLGILSAAVPLLLLVGLCSVVFSAVSAVRMKDSRIAGRLFSPGFALFVAASLILYVANRQTIAGAWDEFSHWMLAPRALWLQATQGIAYLPQVNFPTYPLFVSLIQYFFVRLSGAFSEPVAYFAKNLLLVSFLLPALGKVDWKRWYQAVLLLAVLLFAVLLHFPNEIGSLYIDALMGVVAGGMLFTYFSANEKSTFVWLSVCVLACSLVMMKTNGAAVAALMLAIIFADVLLVQRKREKTENATPVLPRGKGLVACLCILCVFPLVWALFMRSSGIVNERVSAGILSAGLQPYHLEGIHNAFTVLFEPRQAGDLTLSFMSRFALSLLPGFYLIYRARNSAAQRSYSVLISGVGIGFFLYFLGTIAMMLTGFSARLMAAASSLDRYLAGYLVTLLVAIFSCLFAEDRNHKNLLLLAACCCLLPVAPLNQTFDSVRDAPARAEVRAPFAAAEQLANAESDERVWYVDQRDAGEGFFIFHYLAAPADVSYGEAWSFGKPQDAYDDFSRPLSVEQWSLALTNGGYTLVYLQTVTPISARRWAFFSPRTAPFKAVRFTASPPAKMVSFS